MAEGTIRINKVLKDFNIGLSTLTDFLKKKGIRISLKASKRGIGCYLIIQEHTPVISVRHGKLSVSQCKPA